MKELLSKHKKKLIAIALALATLMTIISGTIYLVQNKKIFGGTN